MTFNQWCAGKRIDPHARIALEAIWNAMSGEKRQPTECRCLLDDLLESFWEPEE